MSTGEDPDPGASPTTLADLGERGLIYRLRRRIPAPGPDVLLGNRRRRRGGGLARRTLLLLTTDTLLEGVHFRRSTATLREIGGKAIAVNVSDIAAMGGEPCYALVALALPPSLAVADVDELYAGFLETAQQHGVALVGGDTCAAPGRRGPLGDPRRAGGWRAPPPQRSAAGGRDAGDGHPRRGGRRPGGARAGARPRASRGRRGGRAAPPCPDTPARGESRDPGLGLGDRDDGPLGRPRHRPRAHRRREPGRRAGSMSTPAAERGDARGGPGPRRRSARAGR